MEPIEGVLSATDGRDQLYMQIVGNRVIYCSGTLGVELGVTTKVNLTALTATGVKLAASGLELTVLDVELAIGVERSTRVELGGTIGVELTASRVSLK